MNEADNNSISLFNLTEVLKAYALEQATVQTFGSGLINSTWKVTANNELFILQRVNNKIFQHPQYIASNFQLLSAYFKQHHPGYLFVSPVANIHGEGLTFIDNDYYRLFPFIKNSHTHNVVQTPQQAYEAAAQFGRFTYLLKDFNANDLKITLPDFHNLDLRHNQFLSAIKTANPQRLKQSNALIEMLEKYKSIKDVYTSIKTSPEFKLRVTHHDTKISNVLFDEQEHGLCVIDLDTVMPGYFVSDVGDMMRTYLCPVNEESKDSEAIVVQEDFYKAIVQGYSDEMKEELTEVEREHFFFTGQFMIYMQALRFLTDYLNHDVYYNTTYEEQNFVRAQNQIILLQRLNQTTSLR